MASIQELKQASLHVGASLCGPQMYLPVFFLIALEHPRAGGSEIKVPIQIIPITITTTQILRLKS